MTEILIVIGIVVLLMALAVPAFNLISGGKSIEGATNQISAALGRARAEAIGLQRTTGIMFFIEPVTQRVNVAIVEDVSSSNPPVAPGTSTNVDVWLDVSDADYLALPPGVTAQTFCDATFTGAARTSDGYIGYNTHCTDGTLAGPNFVGQTPAVGVPGAEFGGVILFDGSGRLISTRYGFRCWVGGTTAATKMGQLLKSNNQTRGVDKVPGTSTTTPIQLRSQFGIVLFETDSFKTQGFSLTDPKVDDTNNPSTNYGNAGGSASEEFDEEKWLDENSTPLLINRFNGTLVKGQ